MGNLLGKLEDDRNFIDPNLAVAHTKAEFGDAHADLNLVNFLNFDQSSSDDSVDLPFIANDSTPITPQQSSPLRRSSSAPLMNLNEQPKPARLSETPRSKSRSKIALPFPKRRPSSPPKQNPHSQSPSPSRKRQKSSEKIERYFISSTTSSDSNAHLPGDHSIKQDLDDGQPVQKAPEPALTQQAVLVGAVEQEARELVSTKSPVSDDSCTMTREEIPAEIPIRPTQRPGRAPMILRSQTERAPITRARTMENIGPPVRTHMEATKASPAAVSNPQDVPSLSHTPSCLGKREEETNPSPSLSQPPKPETQPETLPNPNPITPSPTPAPDSSHRQLLPPPAFVGSPWDPQPDETWECLHMRAHLDDPSGYFYFQECLRSHYAEENLLFWTACKILSSVPEEDVQQQAEKIFRTFFLTNGTHELNLAFTKRQAVVKLVENDQWSRGMYDKLCIDIFRQLQNYWIQNYRQDFKASVYYKNYLNQRMGLPLIPHEAPADVEFVF